MRQVKAPQWLKKSEFFHRYMKNNKLYRYLVNCIKCTVERMQRINYRNKSERFYLQNIAKWKKTNRKETGTLEQIANKIKIASETRRINRNRIALIVEEGKPRAVKIASALKDKGYEIEVYYCKDSLDYGRSIKALMSIADYWHEYSTITALMGMLCESNAFIIHYFMNPLDAWNACVILQQKQLFPPIVVEHYDVLNGMYINAPPIMYKREKYAFENADGVVFREFSGEYLKNFLMIRPKKSIIFLDYLEDIAEKFRIQQEKNDELHLVYCGGVISERVRPNALLACMLEFASLCDENKCHLHIYPSRVDEWEHKDYIELDKKKEYFHFHAPLPYEKLLQEIAMYDYGVMPTKRAFLPMDENGILDDWYTVAKPVYCGVNKYFDYIDAELPFISVFGNKLISFFDKYDIVLKWCIEDYDFNLLRREKNKMKENVKKARKEMVMENEINRLIEFYKIVET